jgi:dihydroorotase
MNTTLVESGLMGWADIARIASETPARIGGLTEYETPLAVGSVANITLIDPSDSSPWSPSRLAGKSANTPFTDLVLPGRVVSTMFRGIHTVVGGGVVPSEELERA